MLWVVWHLEGKLASSCHSNTSAGWSQKPNGVGQRGGFLWDGSGFGCISDQKKIWKMMWDIAAQMWDPQKLMGTEFPWLFFHTAQLIISQKQLCDTTLWNKQPLATPLHFNKILGVLKVWNKSHSQWGLISHQPSSASPKSFLKIRPGSVWRWLLRNALAAPYLKSLWSNPTSNVAGEDGVKHRSKNPLDNLQRWKNRHQKKIRKV